MHSSLIRSQALVSVSVSFNRDQIGEKKKKSGCGNLLRTSTEIMAATYSP